MLIPVEITSFAIEPQKCTPLIILKELGGSRSIAVPVDPAEASAIAMHSLQVKSDKPLAVDLVKIVMEQFGAALYRVVISDVSEGAFSACVVIRAPAALKVIDCRPGDAIMLAIKCAAPIFVKEAVFVKLGSSSGLSEEDELKAYVRSVDVTEFGKYVLE
jgi:bifunctional DNase/RNase